MNTQQFISQFLLTPFAQEKPEISSARQAAVLVPLIDHTDYLTVLLTQRTEHLRHHPGQISFPGGRIEANESSAEAALREAQEEIGLLSEKVKLLGRLPEHETTTGFTIHPWVGVIKPPQQWQKQETEVADIFEVPLQYFIQPSHRHQMTLPYKGKPHTIHIMPYQHRLIWGATAAILNTLCQQIR